MKELCKFSKNLVPDGERNRNEGKPGLKQIIPFFEENNSLFDENNSVLVKSSFSVVDYLFLGQALLYQFFYFGTDITFNLSHT